VDIANYSISNRVISWTFVLILIIGGTHSFNKLGQLEFPEFTIKDALIITHYPGASPQQVEEEVTLLLEDTIQQMEQIDEISSINAAGRSTIQVSMKDRYKAKELQQIWDELRKKINDAAVALPPGASQPKVMDDFADVYGILLTIDGSDYSYRELRNYLDLLRREIILVPGVKRIKVSGEPREEIVIRANAEDIAALGLDPNYVFSVIANQNVVSDAGELQVEGKRLRFHPTGEFNAIDQLASVLVSPPGSSELIYLSDIATITRETQESPSELYHSNSAPALSLGVAFSSGVNVVDVSNQVNTVIKEHQAHLPIGMNVVTVYNQGEIVEASVNGFITNLFQSVGIVIAVLLIFMGIRSGLLIGAVLMLTILGTFIAMQLWSIQLQIISLGGLIIALGMLVDNAIVITEGILIGIAKGHSKRQAASNIVKQAQWPLLGATLIAIIAFAPIGFSQDATGEFAGSLFKVLLISLLLSWISALTITPLFADLIFKERDYGQENQPLYQGVIFTTYRAFLKLALRLRWLTLALVVGLLLLALGGMSQVKNAFFPPSNTPIFFVDAWLPEGTDIGTTQATIYDIEAHIKQLAEDHHLEIKNSTTVIGRGIDKFVLPYTPEKNYRAYAQILIEAEHLEAMNNAIVVLHSKLPMQHPDAQIRITRLENGPTPPAKIEARIIGNDPATLRRIAADIQKIFHDEPSATNVRHDWRNPVLILRPQVDWSQAREVGINKFDLDNALQYQYSGSTIGLFREQTHLLPIVVKAPEEERHNISQLDQVQIWSKERNTYIPLGQFVNRVTPQWEDPLIMRRDRKRVLTVMADPHILSDDTADSVLQKLRPKVEALDLPAGYQIEWGGEFESSTKAKSGLFSSLPAGYLIMFLISILLFNAVRAPLAIWATVPLAIIGVAFGLLLLNAPFSFMALLGILSLSGMVIKNGIVLVDQINVELTAGQQPYQAVFDAAVSRVRPVCMAAITTMLGMIPLLFDAFFLSMAVTIIFGLGFATLLTLIVLPTTYCLLHGIKPS